MREYLRTDVQQKIEDFDKMRSKVFVALGYDYPQYKMIWDYDTVTYPIEENGSRYLIKTNKCPLYTEHRYDKAIQRARDIVNSLNPSDDRYTKFRKLYTYRDEFFSYDYYYTYQDGYGTHFATAYLSTGYGPLLKNQAVCEGFADTFKILCDLAGIPCVSVGRNNHAWNYIQMEDGKWYSTDWTVQGDNNPPLYGKNSYNYQGDPRYAASDPEESGLPELADEEYIYQGANEDFSINVVESQCDNTGDGFLYKINDDKTTCTKIIQFLQRTDQPLQKHDQQQITA